MHYSFVTIWKIKASPERVWEVLNIPEQWPEWWSGVAAVKQLHKGNENGVGHTAEYTWKSVLPYTLTFVSEVTKVEHLKCIEGKATGELTGTGKWTFATESDVLTIRYDWNVQTTKWWMNALYPLLKPLFSWNHDVVMRRGAEGLTKKVNGTLLSY